MIEQNKDKWPPDGDRPRQWSAGFLGRQGAPDCAVILRHDAILAPGEELTEYTPTIELTWAEWESGHDDYGLAVDGVPL